MNINHLHKHFKSIFFGGNWTGVNISDTIASICVEEANYNIEGFNTIASLLYHINYYVEGVLPVFKGNELLIRDKYSYGVTEFENEDAWEDFKAKVLYNAKELLQNINELTEDKVFDVFVDEKYGSYYSNIHGIIEHTHYHLGQIVILKKLISRQKK